jgi:hypothetical protein
MAGFEPAVSGSRNHAAEAAPHAATRWCEHTCGEPPPSRAPGNPCGGARGFHGNFGGFGAPTDGISVDFGSPVGHSYASGLLTCAPERRGVRSRHVPLRPAGPDLRSPTGAAGWQQLPAGPGPRARLEGRPDRGGTAGRHLGQVLKFNREPSPRPRPDPPWTLVNYFHRCLSLPPAPGSGGWR